MLILAGSGHSSLTVVTPAGIPHIAQCHSGPLTCSSKAARVAKKYVLSLDLPLALLCHCTGGETDRTDWMDGRERGAGGRGGPLIRPHDSVVGRERVLS